MALFIIIRYQISVSIINKFIYQWFLMELFLHALHVFFIVTFYGAVIGNRILVIDVSKRKKIILFSILFMKFISPPLCIPDLSGEKALRWGGWERTECIKKIFPAVFGTLCSYFLLY